MSDKVKRTEPFYYEWWPGENWPQTWHGETLRHGQKFVKEEVHTELAADYEALEQRFSRDCRAWGEEEVKLRSRITELEAEAKRWYCPKCDTPIEERP